MVEIEKNIDSQTDISPDSTRGPIVLSLKKKKKKKGKKRYSKGFEELQHMEKHLVRASDQMAQAVADGISDYRKRSRKSAQEKRDGAIRDFLPNSGLALSRTLSKSSSVPFHLAQAANSKRTRKRVRRQLRALSRFF